MAQPEHDNRMKFPPTEVDFDNDVGITGQDHDLYPSGGQQARFDWQRLCIIANLSCQSSNDPPTQYRTGTIWYKRSTQEYLIWSGTAWDSLASHINLATGTTLADFYTTALTKLDRIQPRFAFNGSVSTDRTTRIPVPETIQTQMVGLTSILKPLVYLNGLLLDTRLCAFSAGCPIFITTPELRLGEKFTVIIERVDLEITEEVIA